MEIKNLIQKEKFYSVSEVAEILWVKNQTILNAIKSWVLIAINIGTSQKRVNYKVTWVALLGWLDNYSDLNILLQFIDFYANINWFEETKEFINNYFNSNGDNQTKTTIWQV